MKNIYLLGALSLLACNDTHKQELATKYPALKYIDYDFKYINKERAIDLSADAQAAGAISGIDYKDSLRQVLTLELKDADEAKLAFQALTYTWRRLSYHLWLSEEATKAFAAKHNIFHPLQFKYYLLENSTTNEDIIAFKNELKAKLFAATNNNKVMSLDNNALLDFAMLNSEERKEDEILYNFKTSRKMKNQDASDLVCQEYLNSLTDDNGKINKKGCGKTDCCMLACKK
ncbi:hypothetical protein [Chitinophaga agri]|uniref:Lipoprotein n=1 Tax=Chitinophaga agri TaxID=2703787 RepID=A0A6B9ZDI8_9BACT|nr:hypothetical protein [Chitinophaga agri]QHS60430.1 hypothetical protein GWR21_12745 [Chitinophaga agri]